MSRTYDDAISAMYDVADDYEAEVLDGLRLRAGLTWDCLGGRGLAHWTNTEDDSTCGECGRPRPNAD